jgi:competence protein ComEA
MEIRCVRADKSALMRLLTAALAALVLAAAPHAAAQRREPAGRAEQTRAPSAAPAVAQEQAAAGEGVVNIQTASVEELQRLPGIGPAKAQAIVEFRARAPFRRVEEIMRVRGIGRATFRRLRPMLTVSGPTTLQEAVRGARRRAPAEEDEVEQH